MVNERTASAALLRAEALRGRLDALADPPVQVLVMLAHHAARANRAAEARDLAERALACEPYPPPLEICMTLIVTLTLIESYGTLQRLCEDLLAAARNRGAMQEIVGISIFRASASCDCGNLADAEADARWALERAEGVRRIHAVSEVMRVLVERDELAAASDLCGPSCRSVRIAFGSGGSVSDRTRSAACRAGSYAAGAQRLPGVRAAMRAAWARDAERLAMAH